MVNVEFNRSMDMVAIAMVKANGDGTFVVNKECVNLRVLFCFVFRFREENSGVRPINECTMRSSFASVYYFLTHFQINQ